MDSEPIFFFHGTEDEDGFKVFCCWEDSSIGFHFGTREAAQHRLYEMFLMSAPGERGVRIVEVICLARNPIRLEDLFTWSQDDVASALSDAGVLTSDEEWK